MTRLRFLAIGLIAAASVGACSRSNQTGTQEEMLPGPGDGSVVCPGSAACPREPTAATTYYGIAGYAPEQTPTGQPRQLICPGDANCPPGYVGRLLLQSEFQYQVIICRPNDPANPPECKPNTWAIVCTAEDKACPGLPRLPRQP